MKLLQKSIIGISVLLSSQLAFAQLSTTVLTPQEAVELMLGDGIIVSNVTFSGNAEQIGSFTADGTNLGISSGFMMASGDIAVGLGPNDESACTIGGGNFGASDPDLDQLDGLTHNDAAILEFDFVATGDTAFFRYVWASEEYPEYSGAGGCGNVSDVFGFFLSGPGINGPFSNNAINIALIPGTEDFVSIFNLNGGCEGTAMPGDADCNYCEYYVNNGDGFTSPYNGSDEYVQYDGFTLVLTAIAVLECGQSYHIKLALADVSDTAFDSAVFIETDSFSSSGSVTSGVENPPTIDWPTNQIMEDCVDGQFIISTAGFDESVDTLFVTLGGTATNGVDYQLIEDFIVLTEGQNLDTLEITTIADGFGEGPETIELSFPFINECGDLDTAFASLNLLEQTPLIITPINNIVLCGDQQATVVPNGGVQPITIAWGEGQTTPSIPITELGDYEVTVTDYCGQTATEAFEVVPPSGVELDMVDDAFVCPGDDVDVTVTMTSGANPPSVDWTGSNSNSLTATFDSNDAGYQYVTVTDACGQSAIDSVMILIPSPLVGVDDLNLCVNVGTGDLVEGGTPPYDLDYDEEVFVSDQELVLVPTQSGTYEITVTDACGQEVTIPVFVDICDTTIPNVFTPNGDGDNEVFQILGVVDFPRSELYVYNRWGNLVFESSSYSNNWNGADHAEGVYFYIFKRSDGKNFEGYVHLLRN